MKFSASPKLRSSIVIIIWVMWLVLYSQASLLGIAIRQLIAGIYNVYDVYKRSKMINPQITANRAKLKNTAAEAISLACLDST